MVQVRIEGQPLNSVLGIKSRFVGNGGEECSVEELALQYYAAQAGGAWTGKPCPPHIPSINATAATIQTYVLAKRKLLTETHHCKPTCSST